MQFLLIPNNHLGCFWNLVNNGISPTVPSTGELIPDFNQPSTAAAAVQPPDVSGCFHRLANVKKKLFVCLNDCIKVGKQPKTGHFGSQQPSISYTVYVPLENEDFGKNRRVGSLLQMMIFPFAIGGDGDFEVFPAVFFFTGKTSGRPAGVGLRWSFQETHGTATCQAGRANGGVDVMRGDFSPRKWIGWIKV